MTSSVSPPCGRMPPVKTRSAQSRSASLNSSVLRLISRIDQEGGSSAASVIRPSGGAGYFAPKTSEVRLKFQNVSASKRGQIKSALHVFPFHARSTRPPPSNRHSPDELWQRVNDSRRRGSRETDVDDRLGDSDWAGGLCF